MSATATNNNDDNNNTSTEPIANNNDRINFANNNSNTNNKVRWGLLSTARINRRIIPAIRQSKCGELVAVASRTLEKATLYAKEWDIPKIFASYQEMIDSNNVIDAVYISLPNHLHAEWTIKALQSGKHVLCEKPFAMTLQDVDAMINAAQESGKVLAEALMFRHHPQTKIISNLIHKQNRLGHIYLVRGSFNYAMAESQKHKDNPRLFASDNGGGSLWDVGLYCVTMAQFVLGAPPKLVQAQQMQRSDIQVDEFFIGQMNYGNGKFAQICSSFQTPYYTSVEIFGTNGTMIVKRPFNSIDGPQQELLYYAPGNDIPETIHVEKENLYLGEIEDMHRCILDNNETPYISLEETRQHIKTVLALYEAANSGQTVSLSKRNNTEQS